MCDDLEKKRRRDVSPHLFSLPPPPSCPCPTSPTLTPLSLFLLLVNCCVCNFLTGWTAREMDPNTSFLADHVRSHSFNARRVLVCSLQIQIVVCNRLLWRTICWLRSYICTALLVMDCKEGLRWHFCCGCPIKKTKTSLWFLIKNKGVFFSKSQKMSSYVQK